MTITAGVNMITRKMTQSFFFTALQALLAGIFYFCISRPSKFSAPIAFFLFFKIHIYMPKMTISSLLTWITFFYIKFANFLYIICSVSNLIPFWSRPHGLYYTCPWRLSNQKSNKFTYLIRKFKLMSNTYNTSNS